MNICWGLTSRCNSKCIYWNTCIGACGSISYSTGNKLLSPHPFCDALYNAIRKNELDRELIPNPYLVDAWVKGIENEDFDSDNEIIARKQHKLL